MNAEFVDLIDFENEYEIKRLHELLRYRDEVVEQINDYENEIKRLSEQNDNVDLIQFNLPNDKVEFLLNNRKNIFNLKTYLDEHKKDLHDVNEEIKNIR